MSENQVVRWAECCGNCANVDCDYHFRDAVLCNKDNKYHLNIRVCDLFKMTGAEREE